MQRDPLGFRAREIRAKLRFAMSLLPVRLDDLIHARTVESVRIELKATWNDPIRDSVVQTISAFANDFQGLGGGYVVIGIEEQEGHPVLPPRGLDDLDIDKIQIEITGRCQTIKPPVSPVISPEVFQGRQILVLYVPLSDARPHQAPSHGGKPVEYEYYIRIGPRTDKAKDHYLTQLLQLTARVPFDERRRNDVATAAISPRLLAEYLREVGRDLSADPDTMDVRDTLRRLRLTSGSNGAEAPRNAALLFFTDDPEERFAGCRIELAEFHDDAGGDLIETRAFRGPIHRQVQQVLDYLDSLLGTVVRKRPEDLQASRFVAYPTTALREALVNTAYHRDYEVGRATRVALYPNRLEITSYPGPVPGLQLAHLAPNSVVGPSPVPSRNPRVGDMLRAVRMAETWKTGVPKIYRSMKENGSPVPHFDFDETRTYFRVTLPAHPGYVTLHALRTAATLWIQGERSAAIYHLEGALSGFPESGAIAAQLIEYLGSNGDLSTAKSIFISFEQVMNRRDSHLAYMALAKAYLDNSLEVEASSILEHAPTPPNTAQRIDIAILYKRSHSLQRAHIEFNALREEIWSDARALHEWAQVKLSLAKDVTKKNVVQKQARQTLLREALELLLRVISLVPEQRTRIAWAWFDVAKARHQLGEPAASIEDARRRAVALLPGESKFTKWNPSPD
jgi:ATP-dependent DNA helicase RecG